MRNSPERPSTTSLPAAPTDDAHARSRRYLFMMAVRILCFVLMVVITPYGWYTWVLALGAVFLPYFAVVLANAGEDSRRPEPEQPERALTAAPEVPTVESPPRVIRIEERREVDGSDPR